MRCTLSSFLSSMRSPAKFKAVFGSQLPRTAACPPSSRLSSSVASSRHPSCPPVPILLLHHIHPLSPLCFTFLPPIFTRGFFPQFISVPTCRGSLSPNVVITPFLCLSSFSSSIRPSWHLFLASFLHHTICFPSDLPLLCPLTVFPLPPPPHVQVRWRSWSPCG